MPTYPIHPCCYCDKACRMTQKVECSCFLAYIQKLNSMKDQRVLIKELKYLIAPRLSSGQGGK